MKRHFVVALLSVTLSGCGQVEWFPAAGTGSTSTQASSGSNSNTTATASVATVAPFSFSPASVTGALAGSTQSSSTITVTLSTGTSAAISIAGGEYQVNGGSFTSAAGTVANNDTVAVRNTVPAAGGQTVTTLTIGDQSATFTTSAGSTLDATVAPFSFSPAAVTGVSGGFTLNSNLVTVSLTSGTAAAISITGGEYKINGGSYTSAAGTVQNQDTVMVRQTSSASAGQRVTTTLTIGNQSATFSSISATNANAKAAVGETP